MQHFIKLLFRTWVKPYFVLQCIMYVYMVLIPVLLYGATSVSGGKKSVRIPGDFNIGGLFELYEYSPVQLVCGSKISERGILMVEAMLYTIDQINKDPSILPNITLGAQIRDQCRSWKMKHVLNLLSGKLFKYR